MGAPFLLLTDEIMFLAINEEDVRKKRVVEAHSQ